MAQAPTAMTKRGAGMASHASASASRMLAVSGPLSTSASAWRGEATNSMP